MSPVELAHKYVDLGRGMGYTTALINALPDERCAIVTMTWANADRIKKCIMELRPDYNIDNVEFVTYQPNSGWRDKLLFREMHVYFDNDVLDDIAVQHVSSMNQVYGKRLAA